jgi:hypothetical protein
MTVDGYSGMVERLAGAWFDREPGGRATFILLALFVAVWTLFQIVSFSSLDLHFDKAEIYGWSQHPSAGYYPHPPVAALVVAVWFSVFPAADWSYHLLAMSNAALALFAIDLIARRYLTGDKRLFVLLFLLLTPFYQFHSFNFNANDTAIHLADRGLLLPARIREARSIVVRRGRRRRGACDAGEVLFHFPDRRSCRGRAIAPQALDLSKITLTLDFGDRRPGRACAALLLFLLADDARLPEPRSQLPHPWSHFTAGDPEVQRALPGRRDRLCSAAARGLSPRRAPGPARAGRAVAADPELRARCCCRVPPLLPLLGRWSRKLFRLTMRAWSLPIPSSR